MQNNLASHMRNFVDAKVSRRSLTAAAHAERVDRATADKVLMLLAGWEHSARSTVELRARVRDLI